MVQQQKLKGAYWSQCKSKYQVSAAAVVRQKAKREITFGSERKRWSCFLSQICLSAWRWMLLFRNSAQQKYNVVACHAAASVCFRLFGPGGVRRLSLRNSRHVWVRTTASASVSTAGRPLLCLTVNHVCLSALNICLRIRPDSGGSANLIREGVDLQLLTQSYWSLSFPSPHSTCMYVYSAHALWEHCSLRGWGGGIHFKGLALPLWPFYFKELLSSTQVMWFLKAVGKLICPSWKPHPFKDQFRF